MYELTQVAGNSYYIQSPAKIGLVRLNDADAGDSSFPKRSATRKP